MKPEIKFALHDPAHCLAPGLFRSLQRGERRARKLDLRYQHGDRLFHFRGPEPLGADDLRVLQGLVAMAGPRGKTIGAAPKTEYGQQLRTLLALRHDAEDEEALLVKTSYGALARVIGYLDDDDGRGIRKCVQRLWTVTIWVELNGKGRGFKLLSSLASDDVGEKLQVALNPHITKAILGHSQHVRICMEEVRLLKGDIARLLHQRLCGWINPGPSRKVGLHTLCEYAWPEPATPSTLKKRRYRARGAVAELRLIGWTVEECGREYFNIKRPNIPA